MTIYAAASKPFASRLNNRIENFNEFFISLVTYHMLLFTDWVGNPDA